MSVVLDTNVLSELLRASPHRAVLQWMARHPATSLYTSAITQAEMLLGAHLLPHGARRRALASALSAMFEEDFRERVLPFDGSCAARFAEVVATRRAAGRPIGHADAQIAAIALRHRAELATRNARDFEGIGLAIVDPWESAD